MRRLIVQLLVPLLVVVLGFVLVPSLYVSRAFEELVITSLADRLGGEARLVARELPWNETGRALDDWCRRRAAELGVRVTVIGGDGRVLGESGEPSGSLEEHGQRPEIVAARARGLGRSRRFSAAAAADLLYVAALERREGEERFVRLAVPLSALRDAEASIRRTLAYGLLVTIAAGGGVALLLSRRVASRIRKIELLSRRIASSGVRRWPAAPSAVPSDEVAAAGPIEVADDELGALERHLLEMAGRMREQLATAEEERAKLEAVLRSMADGVVVLDEEGRILLCNDCAVEQLGVPPAEQNRGAKLSFLCRNPDLAALVDEVLGSVGRPLQREIVFDSMETPRVLSVSGAPLSGAGEPHGAILVLHDLTALRRLEAVRADFVANVSHELRTPLTAIRGYAETLLAGAIDDRDKAVRFLRVIERHSERLARLIDDLLTLSDLELGKAEIRPRPLVVHEIVDTTLEVLRQKASERSITLVSRVEPGSPDLFGDRDRVEQLLINLVDNAIKYGTPGSEVRVEARGVAGDEGALAVELAVVDNGIGIPEKEIPRLTERFYRVDRARSRALGGTGLGLAIVKHIVQAHAGTMAIDSRLGQGTTVRVVLPGASRAASP